MIEKVDRYRIPFELEKAPLSLLKAAAGASSEASRVRGSPLTANWRADL